MKISLKEFWNSKEKLAIHCDTEEKAKQLINTFNDMGKSWCTREPYDENDTNWHTYKTETCYTNNGGFGYKHGLDDYTIYEFEDVTDFMVEKPKVETNFEHYLDKILENVTCSQIHEMLLGKDCRIKGELRKCHYEECPFKSLDGIKSQLLAPYEAPKPKIELKQWEYDLLLVYKENVNNDCKFGIIWCLDKMKSKGHFKGVTDTSMTVNEILEKSVIVDGK